MDMKFGLPPPGVRLGRVEGSSLADRSGWDSDVEGETLRSREDQEGFEGWLGEDGGEAWWLPLAFGFWDGAESLNTCTVSVTEETQRRVDAALKLML